MDEISGLLDGAHAAGAFVLRARFDPPWALRIRDEAPLALVAVMRGEAVLAHDGAEPVRLGAGDTAIVRGPDHYVIGDGRGTRPQAVIHPGQRCTAPDGATPMPLRDLGHRTWGSSADGGTALLVGVYEREGAVAGRLLAALPRVGVLRRDGWDSPLLPLLDAEAERDLPGQDAVIDRLLDLLLVTALRAWLARPEAGAPAWFRAHGDPVVGTALRRMRDEPARGWTLAELAREAGVSRAALARRFTERMGEPPMRYLTAWRMALAADLLREPGATLASVAPRVGYSTGFALSAAFRRVTGAWPAEHRARARA